RSRRAWRCLRHSRISGCRAESPWTSRCSLRSDRSRFTTTWTITTTAAPTSRPRSAFQTGPKVLALLVLTFGLLADAQPPEHIVEIQVHGNVLTPDTEILRIAGVESGMAVEANTVDDAAARLRASKKFEQVDVLKRFASIADPSQISLVILVDEGPVTLHDD